MVEEKPNRYEELILDPEESAFNIEELVLDPEEHFPLGLSLVEQPLGHKLYVKKLDLSYYHHHECGLHYCSY